MIKLYIIKLKYIIISIIAIGLFLGIGYYYLYSQPLFLITDENFREKATDEEILSACYKILTLGPVAPYRGKHDAFVILINYGDKTSIPYLLWSMEKNRIDENGHINCINAHPFEALELITNQSVGNRKEDWQKWFKENKSKSTMEWWADGFRKEGYNISSDGGQDSINNLLLLLGRQKTEDSPQPERIIINAMKMLDKANKKELNKIIEESLNSKDLAFKRGIMIYSEYLKNIETMKIDKFSVNTRTIKYFFHEYYKK